MVPSRTFGAALAGLVAVVIAAWAVPASPAPRLPAPPWSVRADTLARRFERALNAGDISRGEALADSAESLRRARPGAEPMAVAAFIDSVAIQFFSLGNEAGWAAAHRRFERSLALKEKSLGPADLEVASTLGALATLDDYLGRWDQATVWSRRALDIQLRRLGERDPAVAASRRQLGMLEFQLGHYAAAESLVLGALAIEAARDSITEKVAGLENDLGEIVRVQDRDAEAERYFRAGLAIANRVLPEDDRLRLALINNLAGLYRDRARYADAVPLLEQSLRLRQRAGAGQPALAAGSLNLAEIYRLQGRNDDAAPLYEQALRLARTSLGPDHPMFATFVNQTAVSFEEAGRLSEAEALFREALAIAERTLGPDHPLVAQSLTDLGELLVARRAWAAAESTFDRAVTIRVARLGNAHPDAAMSRVGMARSVWRDGAGDPGRAGAEVTRAIGVLDSSRTNPEARLEAHALRSDIAARAGRRDSAILDLATALDLLDSLRAQRGGGDEARARFVERNLGLYHRMVALRLAAGDADAAFDAHERARARVLRDQIAASGVAPALGVPADELAPLAREEERARDDLARVQRTLDAARLSESLPPAQRLERVAILEAERDRAAHALQRAMDAIKDRSPVWRTVLGGSRAATRTAVQRALRPGEVLVEYHLGDDASWAFVIERGARSVTATPLVVARAQAELRLGEGALTAAAAERAIAGDTTSSGRRRDGLAAMLAGAPASAVAEPPDQVGAALEHRLDLLRQVIVPEPIARRLRGATTAIVVPDGALHLVPFEALVFAPRSSGHAARFWLDEGPAVRYASSVSSWLALEERRAARPGTGTLTPALSVSDPDFARKAPSVWSPLPATRHESEALVAALGATRVTVLQGDAATEREARRWLPGVRLFHLATHGFVTPRESDVLAGLVFAPPADSVIDPTDDGLLQLYEIYALPLNAELAVLSACETARGSRIGGEGVFALSRGFLTAGASRVIASLWNVNDASTAALVSALFRDARPATPGRAPDWTRLLRDAKRAVRSQPGMSAPFHWAPFVLSGVR